MMRILLVEDEESLASIIKKGLEEENYNIDVCHDGETGLSMGESLVYDGIILDLMIPGLDGISLLNALRDRAIVTPVLILSARDTLEDKIKGLDTGADDYLTKPFEFDELLARLRALIRRGAPEKRAVLKVHDLEVDTASREVKRGGEVIQLTAKEYMLLEYLVFNKNIALSRAKIAEHIYDMSAHRESNVIDVFVNSLRNKLNEGHQQQLIETVRGIGYILKD
jgi:DNA-binding response OmpR family regulator